MGGGRGGGRSKFKIRNILFFFGEGREGGKGGARVSELFSLRGGGWGSGGPSTYVNKCFTWHFPSLFICMHILCDNESVSCSGKDASMQ